MSLAFYQPVINKSESADLIRRCAFCDWTVDGTVADTAAAAKTHRESHRSRQSGKRHVCGRHFCSRMTRHPSKLCPEHREERNANLENRGGRTVTIHGKRGR